MVRRSAFTLIELIFAIIVIAITVVSLPMMNQVLANSTNTNLIQEAIFAAATELNEVTTVHWDENSIDTSNTNALANVINVNNQCETNSSLPRYRLRPGHILQPYHRKCLNNLTLLPSYSNTNNLIDATEDKTHTSQHIFLNPTPSTEGYKDDYNSTIVTTFNPSFDGTGRVDLKQVTATIFDEDGNTLVSLTTYVANIGEVDYYKRSY